MGILSTAEKDIQDFFTHPEKDFLSVKDEDSV